MLHYGNSIQCYWGLTQQVIKLYGCALLNCWITPLNHLSTRELIAAGQQVSVPRINNHIELFILQILKVWTYKDDAVESKHHDFEEPETSHGCSRLFNLWESDERGQHGERVTFSDATWGRFYTSLVVSRQVSKRENHCERVTCWPDFLSHC